MTSDLRPATATAPIAADPIVGTVFAGRWRVERTLTSGGMGSVYVAHHGDTGRAVALKVIKSEMLAGEHAAELVERFRRETGALAALSHPNVVTFLDSGVADGHLFLVMELLSGRSLRDALLACGGEPMPWPRAFRIAADLTRALAAVHKAGIVHRDLKPENVFLQEAEGHDEVVKLIDFGIVRLERSLQEAQPQQRSTQTGMVVGTPGYISPEQLRGQPATPASDVYAVGVMLYEMVAGRFPFDAPDVHALLVKQLIDPVPPPRVHVPDLPEHVESAILRLMAREPALRPATARDALALLLDPAAAPPLPSPSTTPAAATATPPRQPTMALGSLPPDVVVTETATPVTSMGFRRPVTTGGVGSAAQPALRVHEGEGGDGVHGRTPATRGAAATSSRRRLLVAAAVAGVLVAGGIAAAALRGGRAPLEPLRAAPADAGMVTAPATVVAAADAGPAAVDAGSALATTMTPMGTPSGTTTTKAQAEANAEPEPEPVVAPDRSRRTDSRALLRDKLEEARARRAEERAERARREREEQERKKDAAREERARRRSPLGRGTKLPTPEEIQKIGEELEKAAKDALKNVEP